MSGMSKSCVNYDEVPGDFPGVKSMARFERWADWGICEDLATHVCVECLQAKAQAHRAERPVDILLKAYMRIERNGWGEPVQLKWVVRRVAALLKWPIPDIVSER